MALNLSLVQDINPGADSSFPGGFTPLLGELYFGADNGTVGDELFVFDPLTGEATLAADINPGAGGSNPGGFTVFDGLLYFAAFEATNGRELYSYDPETEAFTRLSDINPDAGDSFPSDLTVLNGLLYFSATEPTNGRELYSYDPGTDAITRLSDINPDAGSSDPSDLTALNGLLYFSATEPTNGSELYSYDPGTGAIARLTDINPDAGDSDPAGLTVLNGLLYFSAFEPTNGDELYSYDPEAAAVTRLSDINPDTGNSEPRNLGVFEGQLYFAATDDGTTGTELYTYDPADASVALVADINRTPGAGDTGGSSFPNDLTAFQGELYFLADNGINGEEVYKYNPNTDEATLVVDINGLPGSSFPNDLTAFNGSLYLSANDGTATIGQELYSLTPDAFDGNFGPAQVADIGEAGESNFTVNSGGWTNLNQYPRTLADVNGDGLADIVGFGQTSVFVSLSEGDGSFGEAQNVLDAFTPDNGGWTSQNQFYRTAADVNGDGRFDLVGFGADSVFVSLSQEDGTFSEAQVADIGGEGSSNFTVNSGGWTSYDEFPRDLGDFNGDGNYDIIGFGADSVFVSLSNGDGSFGEAQSVLDSFTVNNGGWGDQGEVPRMVGDFNGDGRDDIIGFGFNDVQISFSNADGTFSEAQVADIGAEGSSNFTVNSGGWTSQDQYPRAVADIDGDGRDDIIGFGQDSIFYALSEGDGSFTESEILNLEGASNFTIGAGGWTRQGQFPRFLDDINGDDKADIVGFGSESVFAALA